MTNNQDARPFVDLKKDAEEFRVKFDEDIKECLTFLDTRITSLICDPDSFGTQGRSVHQNTLAEFSKAKYDIFISVKSFINTKEREWLDYIAEMKKFFIENVEIFLAGTKLEVKLPPSESASSHVLGSSFQERKAPSAVYKANDGDKTQFNRRGRLSISSIKLANSPYEEEMDIEEAELGSNEKNSSVSLKQTIDISESENANKFSSKGHGRRGNFAEKKSLTDNINTNNLPPKMHGRRGKLNSSTENVVATNNSSGSDENKSQTIPNENVIPMKGRRGRAATKAKSNNFTVAVQNNSSGTDENVGQTNEMPLKGRRGRSKANDLTVIAQYNSSSTDENESQVNDMPLKGIRGRAVPKTKTKDLIVIAQNDSNSTDKNEHHTAETSTYEIPLKGRRGRTALKAKTDNLTVEADASSKTRKGRSASSKNTSNISDKNVAKKTVVRGRRAVKPQTEEETYKPGPSQSPKKASFDAYESSSDELDMQTPLARPAKSVARRKTLLPNLEDISGADIIPGNPSSKTKRKTISGIAELESVPSKRLKVSQRTIPSQDKDSSADDNLLESDGNYSEWMALKSIDGKVPTRPAVYELKVWRAKKPAFIGSCESLRQKLTLYKLKQNSSHKHLDKFIDRNYDDIQVRYEVVSSFDDAKGEVKDRIKSFVAQHKTTPAYN